MSKHYFNQKAENWDNEIDHNYEIIEKVINLLPDFKDPEILDIGAGTGVLVPFLIDKFGETAVINELDYAEKMLEQAQHKFGHHQNINFISENIFDFNLNRKYELILCYSVFPHFSNKKKILKKLKQGLSPEGQLVIFHSQSRKKINNLHQDKGKSVKKDRLPPASQVREIGQKLGYKIIKKVDNTNFYLLIFEF